MIFTIAMMGIVVGFLLCVCLVRSALGRATGRRILFGAIARRATYEEVSQWKYEELRSKFQSQESSD